MDTEDESHHTESSLQESTLSCDEEELSDVEEEEDDEEHDASSDNEPIPNDEENHIDTQKVVTQRDWRKLGWRGCLGVVAFSALTLQSLGVIYGDIGTSPLYVFTSIFGNDDFGEAEVLGALCMITYSLILVVFLKYIIIVLNANRNGEGGILVLASLVRPDGLTPAKVGAKRPSAFARGIKTFCVMLSFVGVGLLLGDGAITPAISVLSAIEGIQTQYPSFADGEVALGCFIIFLLFIVQQFGTSKVGSCFGPIMLLWFFANGAIGVVNITNHPTCLKAWNPAYIGSFFSTYGGHAWVLLGAVVLAITGVEALYADMGHFGVWPIRVSWSFIVFPSLLLTYYGQAGYLIDNPDIVSNVYYLSLPTPVFWPMFVLAITAALIASQAMISGAFSLIYQASLFDCFPAVTVVHTSKSYTGQVYVPGANYILMAATIALIVFFKTSSNLAAAYGVCVTGVLGITTIIFVVMVCTHRPWVAIFAVPIGFLFFLIDVSYFSANLIKFTDGGWVPLLVASIITVLFVCWWLGRHDLRQYYKKKKHRELAHINLEASLAENPSGKPGTILRTPGIGVFLTPVPGVVPKSLRAYYKASSALPRILIMLHIRLEDRPKVPRSEMLCDIVAMGSGFYTATLRMGFRCSSVNLIKLIRKAEDGGHFVSMQHTNEDAKEEEEEVAEEDVKGLSSTSPHHQRVTFCFPTESLVSRYRRRFWTNWRLGVYNFLNHHSHGLFGYLRIPANSWLEIGTRVAIKERWSGEDAFCGCKIFFQK